MYGAVVVPSLVGAGGESGLGKEVRLKLDVQVQGGGNILDVDGHGGGGS